MAEKVIFSWSGGKDSALALHEIQQSSKYEILSLLTTVTKDYDRISMHGVPCTLLERQAQLLDIPLCKILISKTSSNEEYENKMKEVLLKFKEKGITSVIFGDIFLEDLKKYREDKLAQVDMKAIFPLWKRDTSRLAHRFIDLGFQSVVSCVDTQVLDGKFAGRTIDEQFLEDLPSNIDPCGENGEFHSFVFNGPIFKDTICHEIKGTVLRENRFCFCDLIDSN